MTAMMMIIECATLRYTDVYIYREYFDIPNIIWDCDIYLANHMHICDSIESYLFKYNYQSLGACSWKCMYVL